VVSLAGIAKISDFVLKPANLLAKGWRQMQRVDAVTTSSSNSTAFRGTVLIIIFVLRIDVITTDVLEFSLRSSAIKCLEEPIPVFLALCSYSMDTGGRTIECFSILVVSIFRGCVTFCLRRWHSVQEITVLFLFGGLTFSDGKTTIFYICCETRLRKLFISILTSFKQESDLFRRG
jgi:hypothetical protein